LPAYTEDGSGLTAASTVSRLTAQAAAPRLFLFQRALAPGADRVRQNPGIRPYFILGIAFQLPESFLGGAFAEVGAASQDGTI
jgi:hypothetical protein